MTEVSTSTSEQREPKFAWVILAILFWAQVFLSMGAYAWGALEPFLCPELDISGTQFGMLTSVLYLASLIIATPSGIMVDRIGARIWLITCLLLMGIPFVAMNFANSYTSLLALTAVAGLGYGILNQVSTKGIMYWFTTKFRATALGLKQSAVPIGPAINGVALVAIATAFHWHKAVLLVGILCLVMALVSYILYREHPPEAAVEAAPKPSSSSVPKTPPKQKGGLRAVLTRPELILTMIVTPLLAGGQIGFATHWIRYLVRDAGFTIKLAGACFTVAMVVAAVARPGWGAFSDRVLHGDRMKALIIIFGVALLGSIGATVLLHFGAPVWLAFVAAVLMGAGFFGFHGVLIALAAETAGTELAGSAGGILVTVSWIGIALAPTVYGVISDHWSYTWCWILGGIFAAVGIISYTVFLVRQQKRGVLHGA